MAGLHARIMAGESVESILLDDPGAIRHAQGLREVAKARDAEAAKGLRDVRVRYLFGPPGCGKSRMAWELFGQEMFRATNYAKGHVWDAYQSQRVLVLDEFSGQLGFDELLNALDVYPCELDARYASKWAAWEEVLIISNLPLKALYSDIRRESPARWDALMRRIHRVERMDSEGQIHVELRPWSGAAETAESHFAYLEAEGALDEEIKHALA